MLPDINLQTVAGTDLVVLAVGLDRAGRRRRLRRCGQAVSVSVCTVGVGAGF